jgi:hypothetical protein
MPEPASNLAGADRNLLFGVLALRMEFFTLPPARVRFA